ncbi:cold shock domain-containing protein [Pseudomonas cremoricolorata]|uniref:cold shock domain-containing protein n=1 Tax=Pseudomonas cremoricolorata TaxID=157783 RepID=UPI000402EDF8|nr:cold shock domain-containing protein [Pseudomonas cremoricolorata]
MASGKVKWFNNAKGFGFLIADGKEMGDIFAHYSQIVGDGYKSLKANDRVLFDIIEGPKGPHACSIRSEANATQAVGAQARAQEDAVKA